MPISEFDPESILQRLEWTVIRRLDGLMHGNYRTFFRGFGLDLADMREYQFHDDVRHIDWNLTARLQVPYVRQYNEEREMTAWFLLDISPSVDFGSRDVQKRSVLLEFVAVLARLISRHGNRVGAILYSDRVDLVIPPRSGRNQVLHILSSLQDYPKRTQSAPTDLTDFMQAAIHVIRRRSFVFVISDFISKPGWSKPLMHLARRNEVLAVRLFDPLELELPNLGLFVMQDSETGEQLFVDSHDRGFRKRFAEISQRREMELRSALQQAGVDTLELSTDDDLVETILRFADLRKQRSKLATGGSIPAHMEIKR
jgi:uncharacterized protein (DUF58 family)